MGMDIYGIAPSTPMGTYFRNNAWWWRPLANYCQHVAPALYSDKWQYNDGAGLDADDSVKLANLLQREIDRGACQDYAEEHAAHLKRLMPEQCKLCHGTGIRDDEIGRKAGQPKEIVPLPQEGDPEGDNPRAGMIGWCNGCNGRGYRRPTDTWYGFSVENVQEFVKFLRSCGGFKIY